MGQSSARQGLAALAGAGIALFASGGCDDARPTAQAARSAASAAPATTAAASVGDATKLNVRPPAVMPEQRLRQRPVGKTLVIDSQGAWAPDCAIHHPCRAPKALDVCPPQLEAEPWASLSSKAEHFTDPRVSVKGQLVMTDDYFSTAVRCPKGQCCNGCRAKIALAGPPYDLELVGLGCSGDESRLCCPLSARGEEVIASGRLRYTLGRLLLESPQLCLIKAD